MSNVSPDVPAAVSARPRSNKALWITLSVLGGGLLLSAVVVVTLVIGFAAGRVNATGDQSQAFRSKPKMPITVTYRKAEFGPGLVAQFFNQSDRYLTVIVTKRNPTLHEEKRVQIDLPARTTKELGWNEGVKWVSGDQVIVEHADYADINSRMP